MLSLNLLLGCLLSSLAAQAHLPASAEALAYD
jgi:hypothetical protein